MRVHVTGHPDINVTNGNGRGIALYQAGAHICFHDDNAVALLDAVVAIVDQNRKNKRRYSTPTHLTTPDDDRQYCCRVAAARAARNRRPGP